MNIRVLNLTPDTLERLPELNSTPSSCKYCVYWEYPELSDDRISSNKKIVMKMKKEWIEKVNREFGDCGRLLSLNNRIIGYSAYAPARYYANVIHYPLIPEPDVVLIACLFVFEKKHRRAGFGTVLLNAVIEDLENRKIGAVQVIGQKDSDNNPAGPAEFYLKNGFMLFHDHPEFPILRLDIR